MSPQAQLNLGIVLVVMTNVANNVEAKVLHKTITISRTTIHLALFRIYALYIDMFKTNCKTIDNIILKNNGNRFFVSRTTKRGGSFLKSVFTKFWFQWLLKPPCDNIYVDKNSLLQNVMCA